MDFAFSDEQELLRATARQWLADRYPLDRVAALADSERGWDPASWSALDALGWLDPELDVLDLAVLAEETGYALYPGPWWSHVGLAAPVLAEAAAGGAAIPAGPTTLGWADTDVRTLSDAARTAAVRAEPDSGGWRLTGRKLRVPDAAAASLAVLTAQTDDGVALFGVDLARATVEPVSTMDRTRRYGSVRLDQTGAELLVPPAGAAAALRAVRSRALALLACEAVGVLDRALELAVTYAKDRTQFGRAIGSFQAVGHRLADTYAELQLARSLAYRAAWCVAVGDAGAATAVATAMASVGDAAVTGCERAIQSMGGIGFTWEHPLHRFYKRAQWIASVDGSPRTYRRELAAALLDAH
jgi:alkylation response protein AidB-like acyl-CoA dehydrogenase